MKVEKHRLWRNRVYLPTEFTVSEHKMENYTKGEVKEVEDPFPFRVEDSLQMRVTAGSKIRNLMGFGLKNMTEKNTRQITWNGSGAAISKTITCAEIMKRKIKGLHQITKIRYRRVEEYWTPKVKGLEVLKVNRDIPAISILLSKDPLDSSEPGYQPPGNFETFWQEKRGSEKAHSGEHSRPQQKSTANHEMQASKRKRRKPYQDNSSGVVQPSTTKSQATKQNINVTKETDHSKKDAESLTNRQSDRDDDIETKESMDISEDPQVR